ncbi:MAG: GNAT family N-acetyltransferase [Ferruginibacter sp.]
MAIFETEKLICREFELSDAPFILILLNDPGWIRFIGDRNIRSTEDASNYLQNGPMKSYTENGFGLWMVEIKVTLTPIGMCGLIKRKGLENVDIGFALIPEFAGKGYAYEIAIATMNFAKNILHIDKVVAITSAENLPSIRLLNKIGMSLEKIITLPGEEVELLLFSETPA